MLFLVSRHTDINDFILYNQLIDFLFFAFHNRHKTDHDQPSPTGATALTVRPAPPRRPPRRPRRSYLDARKKLLGMLNSPDFNSGDQIPAERELSEVLGISRVTVRKIITELIDEGVLERRGNQGTWLVDTAIERPLQPALGISKILELNGAVPSSQLIYFHISAATAH